MQCRSLVTQFGRHAADFQAAHTQVLIILGEPIDRALGYAESLKLPFPVLADPDRRVYQLYGLHKTLGLIQRSAAVIIDRQGVIQFVKSVNNPLTWLSEYEELYHVAHDSSSKTAWQ